MNYTRKFTYIALCASLFSGYTATALAGTCTFDNTKTCTLFRDILNDKTPTGLRYYAPTNYDHRFSGEIEVFNAALVQPYTDSVNSPGQLKLTANRVNGQFQSGEIMTRVNLNLPPYNAPTQSQPFTTNDITHGYVVAVVKLPKCDTSDDGLCKNNTAPNSYTNGLWPSVWMLPTMDTNWPQNGEIDTFEAYQLGRAFNVSTATLHFNGNDSRCIGGDCKGAGYHVGYGTSTNPLYDNFHSWGFEWQPDPASKDGGMILTGYFDNVKIWGPLTTDSLPADGPNAFSRGFHDPNGGFYLIAALAVGGPYAGAPSSHLLSSTMYVQSIRAYTVSNVTPPAGCLPPVNIQSMYEPDKKQATIAWEAPANSATIKYYQVSDWQNRLLWQGTTPTQRVFQDQTLPGTSGKFLYFLSTVCTTSTSPKVEYDLQITLKK